MKIKSGFIVSTALLIVVVVLVIAGSSYYIRSNSRISMDHDVLPSSFTIVMHGDYSSSGAGRAYDGKLTFLNNKVVDGFQSYKVWEGGTCKENCNREIECIVNNQQWVDKINGDKCMIDTFSSPLAKNELESQIKEGKLIQEDDISKCHGVTCYNIDDKNIINIWKEDIPAKNILQSLLPEDSKSIQESPVIDDNKYDDFALCLKNNGVILYGASWCSHCNSIKETLGSSMDKFSYVECSNPDKISQKQICIDKKIEGYPTWEFADGSFLIGEVNLKTISKKSSCILPN